MKNFITTTHRLLACYTFTLIIFALGIQPYTACAQEQEKEIPNKVLTDVGVEAGVQRADSLYRAERNLRAFSQFQMPVLDGYVPVDDSVRLRYRIVGSGPDTVLVLHGGPGLATASLEPDLRPLALSRTLLFYDQRGAGESTLPAEKTLLHWRHYVSDLEALREHFGLEKMTLIGWSWGGHLSVRYAIQHPDRVERLMLMSAGPPPAYGPLFRSLNPTARLDSASLAKLKLARERWGETPDAVQQCWNYYLQTFKGYTSNPAYARTSWGDVCNVPQETLLNPHKMYALTSMGLTEQNAYNFKDELHRVTVPVLMTYGEDEPFDLNIAYQWEEGLPNDQLVIVKNAGHGSHFERPEIFFPLAEAFLNGEWPVTVDEAVDKWPPGPGLEQSNYERTWWEITAAHDQLEAAIGAKNPDRAADIYTDNALLLAPRLPPIRSHGQIRAYYNSLFNQGVANATFQTLEIEGDDRQLVEGGRYTLRDSEGEILDFGKYMVIWVKVEGRWRAHRDIFNTSTEP